MDNHQVFSRLMQGNVPSEQLAQGGMASLSLYERDTILKEAGNLGEMEYKVMKALWESGCRCLPEPITYLGNGKFTMRYVQGVSLQDFLRYAPSSMIEQGLLALLRAVEELGQDFMHLDLHGLNVIMTLEDDVWVAVIIDFGVSYLASLESKESYKERVPGRLPFRKLDLVGLKSTVERELKHSAAPEWWVNALKDLY